MQAASRALQEELAAAAHGWDGRYAIFEQWIRFQVYGEPRARTVPTDEVFYPKFKPLKLAIQNWERDQLAEKEAACAESVEIGTPSDAQPAGAQPADAQPFFDVLLPAILRTACSQTAAALAAACEPLEGGGCRTLTRSQVACYLANAFLLHVPRGSALDFYGGGKDPLYTSGGRVAPEKLRAFLSYLEQATAVDWAEADEEIRFERVGGGEAGHARERRAEVAEPDAPTAEVERVSAEALADAAFPLSDSETRHAMIPYPLEHTVVEMDSHEPHQSAAQALLVPSSVSFGGGPPSGLSATEEEVMLICFTEALLALVFAAAPLRCAHAILIVGVRRFARCTGIAHQMRFEGAVRPAAAPSTLLGISAAAPPGEAQFAPRVVEAEIATALVGLRALRRCAPNTERTVAETGAEMNEGTRDGLDKKIDTAREGDGDRSAAACTAPLLTTGLWGCGGFRGGQPLLRMLILATAAALAGARLRLLLPPGLEDKWFRGVLAELKARRPPITRVRALMCAERAQRQPRFAADVPAFGSLLVRSLREDAAVGGDLSSPRPVGKDTQPERAAEAKKAKLV